MKNHSTASMKIITGIDFVDMLFFFNVVYCSLLSPLKSIQNKLSFLFFHSQDIAKNKENTHCVAYDWGTTIMFSFLPSFFHFIHSTVVYIFIQYTYLIYRKLSTFTVYTILAPYSWCMLLSSWLFFFFFNLVKRSVSDYILYSSTIKVHSPKLYVLFAYSANGAEWDPMIKLLASPSP